MNIQQIALACLFVCSQASAASFDCTQARSIPEKLICSNPELSTLDGQLGERYSALKQPLSAEESKRLAGEQLSWLRTVRNRCGDVACLVASYKNRLAELAPSLGKQVTCADMRQYPQRIFSGDIDLGSGSLSPIDVDYRCPDSLSEQPFMQKLLALAERVRGSDGPQSCSGTIVHAQWRYYYFSLAQAGFLPGSLPRSLVPMRKAMDWNAFARLDQSDEGNRAARYFKQWSEQSPFNLGLYGDFTAEFDRVLPMLAQHYASKLALPPLEAQNAQNAAKNALMLVVLRAAGSFPHDELQPASALLQRVRLSQSTLDEVRALLNGGDNAGPNKPGRPPEAERYRALQVALINNRALAIVSALADSVPAEAWPRLAQGKEPLLSLALGSRQNLDYLLSRHVPVDAANDFGKTALFYAIDAGNPQAVETLLKSGAHVDLAYKSAKQLRPDDDECTFPDLKHTRRTPLMHAAQHGDAAMLKLLVQAGAQLQALDDLGYNAADYARMEKKTDNETYLKSLGLQCQACKGKSGAASTVAK